MVGLGCAFLLTAGAAGWGLRTMAASPAEDHSGRAWLGGGALPLLHAQEESALVLQTLSNMQNTQLAAIQGEINALQSQLAKLEGSLATEKKKLTGLEQASMDEQASRKATMEEKKRLDALLAAFKEADGERARTQTAMAAALPPMPGGLTPQSLDAWKKEWAALTQDASDKIEQARTTLQELRLKKSEWEAGKDSFPPDKQKELQEELRSLHASAASNLQAAREAVTKTEKPLGEAISARQKQMDEVAKSLPDP